MSILRSTFIAGAVATFVAAPVMAQNDIVPLESNDLVRIAIETSAGRIVLDLDRENAPLTTANFLRYVDSGRYVGGTFYRAIGEADQQDFGIVQGGLQGSGNRPYDPVAHEPTNETGISNLKGTIALARLAPGTGTSEFFIMMGDTTSFDADPEAEGDNAGYAAFGRVVEGYQVLRNIQLFPKSPDAELEVMRGQMLETPVRITAVERVED